MNLIGGPSNPGLLGLVMLIDSACNELLVVIVLMRKVASNHIFKQSNINIIKFL